MSILVKGGSGGARFGCDVVGIMGGMNGTEAWREGSRWWVSVELFGCDGW